MSAAIKTLGVALLALGLSMAAVAQETAQDEERTAPAVAGITADDNGPPPDEARPDTRPVTGFLPLTVGSFGVERSFLAPTFRFSETVDSDPGVIAGQTDAVATTNLSGNALLQQVWRQSQFSLNYTAGGAIYAGHADLNSAFQQAHVQQAFESRRWSLTLADDVTYAPESAFGFPGLSDSAGSSFVSGTAPNQTILTNQSEQLTNIGVGQLNYDLNRQSSLTFAGSFGLQRFQGNGLVDSDQGSMQVGYNYQFDPRDSLGASYGYTLIRYPGAVTPQKLDSQRVQLAYARRVTGRLALRVSGGPQFNAITDPILGPENLVTWMAQGALVYRFRRSEMEVSYGHSVDAGAGVLTVAKTDQLEGNLTTRFTRTLSATFRAGYAHNTDPQSLTSSLTPAFNTEFVNVRIARPFGRELTGFLTYTFQHQTSNGTVCTAGSCGDLSRQVGGIGFDWHMRPLLIR